MELGALAPAVSVGERVQRHAAPSRIAGPGRTALIGHDETRGEPNPRQDLDRFEDGKRHDRRHQDATDDDDTAHPAWELDVDRLGRLMRRILALAFAVVLTGCSVPGSQVEDGPGIVGTYVVNGVDPLDVEYSGTVVITDGEGAGDYLISWLVTGAIQEGVGTLVGNELRVEWETVEGPRGDSRGTAVYTIGDDGVLTGTRTVDGLDGVGTEEIFPAG